MLCRPARRMTNTKGIVFHASAMTSAQNDAVGLPNQDMGAAIIWERSNKLLRIPYWSLKIHAHNTAITAVGSVQGTRRTVRTALRPLTQVSADRASIRPAANS